MTSFINTMLIKMIVRHRNNVGNRKRVYTLRGENIP